MANEIKLSYSRSGRYTHAVILSENLSQAAAASSGTLGSYSAGSWGTYAIDLTELGSTDIYAANVPASLPVGFYVMSFWDRAASAATSASQTADTPLQSDEVYWDGTRFYNTEAFLVAGVSTKLGTPAGASVSADIAANATAIGNLPNAATIASTIWDKLLTGITTAGSIGKLIKDYLDAAISTRSTYTGTDTSGTTTLLSRLSSQRATNLDNLDAAVSTRSTYAGGDTSGTTTLLSRVTSQRATNLDNLDAAVSTRSTYAGADTPGTTTLLGRITAQRAGYLDNISVAPPTAAANAVAVVGTDKMQRLFAVNASEPGTYTRTDTSSTAATEVSPRPDGTADITKTSTKVGTTTTTVVTEA